MNSENIDMFTAMVYMRAVRVADVRFLLRTQLQFIIIIITVATYVC